MSRTKLILAIAFITCSLSFKAQECGVFPDFYWQIGSNNVPVFHDSTSVGQGWEITGYSWNFGDGGTSTQENPSHAYSQQGNYTVCLLVTAHNATLNESCYAETCWQYDYCGALSGSFTYQVNGDTVTFNASGFAEYGPPTYLWTFGDNSPDIEGQLVDHVYNSPGIYNVNLTVLDANNCGYNVYQSVTISTVACTGVQASFSHTELFTGIIAQSTSTTNGLPLNYEWHFNGEPSTQTQWYGLQPGTYEVCLSVGVLTEYCNTYCESIVLEGNPICEGFDLEILEETNQAGEIVLTALATGGTPPYGFSWNNGSFGQQIVLSNVVANSYCVFASDSYQCLREDCDTLVTIEDCGLSFGYTGLSNNGITTFHLVANGGTAPYTYYVNESLLESPTYTTDQAGTYCFLIMDALGCTVSDCFGAGGVINYDTICGYVFNDLNGNGIFNDIESGIPNSEVYLGNHIAVSDTEGYWQAIVPTGIYYVYYCADQGDIITAPSMASSNDTIAGCGGYYNVNAATANGNCNYNFGVQLVSMSVCGQVFFDVNANEDLDENEESGLGFIQVILTSSTGQDYVTYTNTEGNYCIYIPAGEYTIHIEGDVFTACNMQPQVILISGIPGQSLANENFAIQCPPGSCDLTVDIIPQSNVTPGFPSWYAVYMRNEGGTVASGTINYFYDNSALIFNSATPAEDSHDATAGNITWNISDMLPGQCISFWLNFTSPTTTQLGNSVFALASIDIDCSDINPSNNTDSLHQTVVGSWDPNNKLAYKTNHDSNTAYQWISSIESDQRIEYVINFQNTGSAPAVNVVIEDIISEDLDMSSFQVLGASHPMYTLINGNDINFRFDNIMLPDSTNNEPESHGFVRFAINAVNGLSAGHIISDDAAIYFDFNEPVITNAAEVELLDIVGINDKHVSLGLLVYPNPMDNSVQFKNKTGRPFSLSITDAMGRTVLNEKSISEVLTIERGNLASGVYLYHFIDTDGNSAKGKLMVR